MPYQVSGEPPREDILVIIYEFSGLRLRDKTKVYEYTFVKEPKDALKGALLLKRAPQS